MALPEVCDSLIITPSQLVQSMSAIPHAVIALAETLERRWKQYLHNGDFDAFVEFTLSLNGLTEQLDRLQPVSYTHLDVYKRQKQYDFVGRATAHL